MWGGSSDGGILRLILMALGQLDGVDLRLLGLARFSIVKVSKRQSRSFWSSNAFDENSTVEVSSAFMFCSSRKGSRDSTVGNTVLHVIMANSEA